METFANRATALLVGDIDDTTDVLIVDDAEQPNKVFPVTGNFRIRIDDEIIIVGDRSGDQFLDMLRAQEGTEATPHTSGAHVVHVLTVEGFAAGVQDGIQQVIMVGTGSPEGNVIATTATMYRDTTGGEIYLKVGGSGDTGWVALNHAESTVHAAFSGLLDNDHTQYVQEVMVNAKGDLLVGTGDNAVNNLAVGTNGQRLTADSTQTEGVKWA
jgi:hypothetical protein